MLMPFRAYIIAFVCCFSQLWCSFNVLAYIKKPYMIATFKKIYRHMHLQYNTKTRSITENHVYKREIDISQKLTVHIFFLKKKISIFIGSTIYLHLNYELPCIWTNNQLIYLLTSLLTNNSTTFILLSIERQINN